MKRKKGRSSSSRKQPGVWYINTEKSELELLLNIRVRVYEFIIIIILVVCSKDMKFAEEGIKKKER